MARVIAVANQKGGVGKTTTAVHLAAALADAGRFVLLIDLDPQSNATVSLGHPLLPEGGIYEAISGDRQLRDVVADTQHAGLRLAPSTVALAGATVELVPLERREFRLHDALLPIRSDYDYIIIDCPPSLGLLTVNAFTAADEVLVPVQAEYLALEGLSQLIGTVGLVQQDLGRPVVVLGAVLTMYDDRMKLSEEVLGRLYATFPRRVFRSVIPRHPVFADAPRVGRTVFQTDPGSRSARAYRSLAKEVEAASAGSPFADA
jgi:chromosome partitioning protein